MEIARRESEDCVKSTSLLVRIGGYVGSSWRPRIASPSGAQLRVESQAIKRSRVLTCRVNRGIFICAECLSRYSREFRSGSRLAECPQTFQRDSFLFPKSVLRWFGTVKKGPC